MIRLATSCLALAAGAMMFGSYMSMREQRIAQAWLDAPDSGVID